MALTLLEISVYSFTLGQLVTLGSGLVVIVSSLSALFTKVFISPLSKEVEINRNNINDIKKDLKTHKEEDKKVLEVLMRAVTSIEGLSRKVDGIDEKFNLYVDINERNKK